MHHLLIVSLQRVLADRRGISALEYGILAAVVVAAVAAFASGISGAISGRLSAVTGAISGS